MNGNGGEKLIDRILSDARTEADAVISSAEKSAESIKEHGRREAEKILADAEKSGKEAADAVFDRVRTNSELESRKLLLQKKREVLDAAFEKAKNAFSALEREKLVSFFCGLLKKECTGHETIMPAAKHADIIKEAVEKANAEAFANCSGLKIAGTCDADGGFMITADGYEKDCSVDAVFKMFKDSEQTAAARILFR